METEIWKPVVGYEGDYEVSNLGKIKSIKFGKEKILKLVNSNKYKNISLCKNNKTRISRVHRIVSEAFIPNPEKKPQINHINGIKSDNRVENLEWCTSKENSHHAWSTKLSKITDNHISKKKIEGKDHFNAKVILQYSTKGEFIKEWGSMARIERELGINSVGICFCCNGKRQTAGGFIWKFKPLSLTQK